MLQLKALWQGNARPFGSAYNCAIGDTVTAGGLSVLFMCWHVPIYSKLPTNSADASPEGGALIKVALSIITKVFFLPPHLLWCSA
jgi:hypothetical protein